MTDAPSGKHPPTRRLRLAAVLLAIGLLLELIAVAELTPGRFLLFALVGAPLIIAAMGLYLTFVLRILRKKDAL